MQEKLQKVLSHSGIASRRAAEKLILNGRVKINGRIAQVGDKVEVNKDEITVDNKEINLISLNLVYYLVHKPLGYTCTTQDKHAKKLITELVPTSPKVWPVGRLDKNSSGLIILTNDGDLTHQLTHPSFEHSKEYEVILNKNITPDFIAHMKKGVQLEEGRAQADKITKIDNKKFKLILHQGWKRQIRRMCLVLGYKVLELKRTSIGPIKLGNLKVGQYKKIKNVPLS